MSASPPRFWWPNADQPAGLWSHLAKWSLYPFSLAYGRTVARRMAQPGAEPDIPVVCIGNFVAGGAGKTPTALAVFEALEKLGMRPAFVTRGYGGQLATSSLRVDPARHLASEVGDEPLLLARRGPTFVGPDRLASIKSAAEFGTTCVIFDDGLQNPSIAKNLSIAVVDAATGSGNGLCHPAGPLRAPVKAQLHHTDLIVLVGKGAAGRNTVRAAARRGIPVLPAHLEMDVPAELEGKPLYAFSGIGHPGKFFTGLRDAGFTLVKERPFPDHHPFSSEEAAELVKVAEERKAVLVTTQKDGVRFSGRSGALGALDAATTQIPVRLIFEDAAYLHALLRQAITCWRREMALIAFD